ncbi:MAG: 3-hydroxyacyl-CoA dehydrogenase [Betaproteobacteria bacterium]|nr:3-hydroxyacyl-CoA dehydrogenase [Betaproteobacteria bacterium]
MHAALPKDAVVAVFGAGAMGIGIAQTASAAGHRVLVFDARIAAADDARKKLQATFAALAQKGALAPAEATAAAERIRPIHAIGDAVSARLVVEAIVEDAAAKRELLRQLEVVVAPDAILASNTSSLSITALAAGLKHPQRVAGMHFFNPVPLMPLVEIVSGLATGPDVAATLYDTALAWGKSPVHAGSTPGFVVNRCARPYYAEAWRLLAERAADVPTIDAVMREAGGFRMGPFELMDLVGHDVNHAVTQGVWEGYFHDPRYTPSVAQREMVAAGLLGRKSGRGFYDYAPEAVRPAARTLPASGAPERVSAYGNLGPAEALAARLVARGVAVERGPAQDAFPDGVLAAGGAWLALTDGRTATGRAATTGARDLVVFDLAFDYGKAARIAVARADQCGDEAFGAAVGLLQAAGLAVSQLDDVAGLAVMRTVAMLVNEAADAATQGVASAEDIDVAMRKGVSYPAGPFAWGDAIGCARVRDVLRNLHAHYGEARYRVSPLVARRSATGAPLAGQGRGDG